jgi:hypothetical protein
MTIDFPGSSDGVVHVTVPMEPTAGAVQDTPAGADPFTLRNHVHPLHQLSLTTTVFAVFGPSFVTVMWYVILPVKAIADGAVIVVARSAVP